MLGQEIAPTDYDLRFRCFGFPVRVNPWFWAVSAFLWWSDRLDYVLIGVAAVFVSILWHELGHAFANRYYGGSSEIVLYHFGGYATRTVDPSRMGRIIISAAGPAAGLLLWGVLYFVTWQFPGLFASSHELVHWFLFALFFINGYWSLMNLLPIWPLDGGQIAHQVIGRFRAFDAWELTLKVSMLVCAGIVGWCAFEFLQTGHTDRYLVFLFGLLGFQNFQTLQVSTRGRW
jgi:Zn-dependent protease